MSKYYRYLVFKIIAILIGAPKMEDTDTEVVFSYYVLSKCIECYDRRARRKETTCKTWT
jgi:hypothetical protein